MSLGYPLTSENPRLDALPWRYWWSSFGEYQVVWNNNLVNKITGHPETVALILEPGNAVATPAAESNEQEPPKSGKPTSAESKRATR